MSELKVVYIHIVFLSVPKTMKNFEIGGYFEFIRTINIPIFLYNTTSFKTNGIVLNRITGKQKMCSSFRASTGIIDKCSMGKNHSENLRLC